VKDFICSKFSNIVTDGAISSIFTHCNSETIPNSAKSIKQIQETKDADVIFMRLITVTRLNHWSVVSQVLADRVSAVSILMQ